MTTSEGPLFTPLTLGPLTLSNRIVMAPMTRCRAGDGDAPTALGALYYEQRASAGLLVTEGSQVSQQGIGYLHTPGIYTDAQVEGWRLVTSAVHRKGSRIFLQLWHVGRASHELFQPGKQAPVAPSAIAVSHGHLHTSEGPKPYATPRALDIGEIPGVIEQFAEGARRAKAAGFDGVEIHGANGYIVDQFLRDGSNQRTDRYGGSAENRARFLLETVDAVTAVFGADRVGVRIAPTGTFNDMKDSDPKATFGHAAAELSARKIVYLHVVEPIGGPMTTPGAEPVLPVLRERFQGVLIVNGGYTRDTADAAIASGAADLVSFASSFLANPDLPERLLRRAPLNKPDVATFYTQGAHGYTDYPRLDEAPAAG